MLVVRCAWLTTVPEAVTLESHTCLRVASSREIITNKERKVVCARLAVVTQKNESSTLRAVKKEQKSGEVCCHANYRADVVRQKGPLCVHRTRCGPIWGFRPLLSEQGGEKKRC